MSKAIPLGPLMMDLQGTQVLAEELEMLRSPVVGGVILFTRNFESMQQLVELVQTIKQARSPALLVAVDHEGGRVQRFRKTFTELPSLQAVGKAYEANAQSGLAAAYAHAWLMASELLSVGIDFSFAPVLDIDIGLSSVIGDRSFHHDKKIVTELGIEYMRGMHAAGMMTVGKHFPGHGQVKGDTHKEKPIDCRSIEAIMELDGFPFSECIREGLAAVMPAHVVYDSVDNCPAGYSSFWLKDILRQQLKFEGVIFSDDLSMAGAETSSAKPITYTQRMQNALQAGCDMGLVCNDTGAAQQVIENLDKVFLTSTDAKQSSLRRNSMRGKQTAGFHELVQSSEWRQAKKVCDRLKTSD